MTAVSVLGQSETAAVSATLADLAATGPQAARLLASIAACGSAHVTLLARLPRRPAKAPAGMTVIDAHERGLAAEYAAAYGYGVVGAHTTGAARTQAGRALAWHQDQQAALLTALTSAGAHGPAPDPAYVLPFAVTSATAARRLAAVLEDGVAAAYADLVAGATAGDRQSAALALGQCAVRGGPVARRQRARSPGCPNARPRRRPDRPAVAQAPGRRASASSAARSSPDAALDLVGTDGPRVQAADEVRRERERRGRLVHHPAGRLAEVGPQPLSRGRQAVAVEGERRRVARRAAGPGAGPSPGSTRAPASAGPAARAAPRPLRTAAVSPTGQHVGRAVRDRARRCRRPRAACTALAWSAAGCSIDWYAAATPTAAL